MPNTFRFIHTADIHLDSPLQGLEIYEDAPVEQIRKATRRAFENLVELAIEDECSFIIIAGDLYDGDWKDYNTGLFFVSQMGRLHKAGIKVFIVSGNHDAASQITKAMPLPDNVVLFPSRKTTSIQIEDLGVMVHGRSFASRAVSENLANDYPLRDTHYFNIGILHTSLTGRQGHDDYAPCSVDDLKSKGYDYWALGHVHKRETIASDPWIVFPGNLQGRHIKEAGAKGVTLVTVDEDKNIQVEHRPLDVLRWAVCQIDLSSCESAEDVHDQVRAAMQQEQVAADDRPLALRLLLTGSSPLHVDLHARSAQWTEEFRGIALSLGDIWLEKVQYKTQRKVNLQEITGDDSPLSELLLAIDNFTPSDNEDISTLVPDLAKLRNKLPASLLESDSLLNGKAENLDELREAVKELLIAKMIHHKGGA